MNCPSRTDEPAEHDGWNQNPSELAADVTTRQDLNGIVNLRTGQDSVREAEDVREDSQNDGPSDYRPIPDPDSTSSFRHRTGTPRFSHTLTSFPELQSANTHSSAESRNTVSFPGRIPFRKGFSNLFLRIWRTLTKFCKFIGPGFMISVAYIDPGNYSTDVSAGAATKYKLLFIILMSNIFAIVLQSLAVRLGTVTGLNLAQHCRAHLPRWLNIILYIVGECAIVATDIAEVRLQCVQLAYIVLIWVAGHRVGHCAQLTDKSTSRLGLRYHHR